MLLKRLPLIHKDPVMLLVMLMVVFENGRFGRSSDHFQGYAVSLAKVVRQVKNTRSRSKDGR